MTDLVEKFDEIILADMAYPIDFDAAWKWVGYSTKGNALRSLEENFKEGEDFDSLKKINQSAGRGGDRKTVKYRLTADCFKAFCMMAGTEKGKEVRRYFIEAEKKLRQVVADRRLSKVLRRELTDAIQDSHLNDTMHGFAYKQFTDLIYRAVLGMDAKHFREARGLDKSATIREHLTSHQAASVAKLEKIVTSLVDIGADYSRVKSVIEALGVPQIGSAA